jgi:DNA-directed RNA polymerase specialized sigma24 family protein
MPRWLNVTGRGSVARDGAILERILAKARMGDAPARGELLELYRICLRLVARALIIAALRIKREPSDLVHETFVKARREFTQCAGRTEPELVGWRWRILVRSLANLVKHHRRQDRDHERDESHERLLNFSSLPIRRQWLRRSVPRASTRTRSNRRGSVSVGNRRAGE